jgi:hypothetical protein
VRSDSLIGNEMNSMILFQVKNSLNNMLCPRTERGAGHDGVR